MAQAATPGGPGLPCSPKQALALYQHIFRRPADLGQLQAALGQVQEGWACPSGLELPTVLLEMERSRRAQEQLLWDLELLTGAGLGLFWPPRVQLCDLRDKASRAWNPCSSPRAAARTGGSSEQLTSQGLRLCPSARAADSLSQNHQLPEGGLAADPSSAPDLGQASRETDPRRETTGMPAADPTGMPADPTPGGLQELNATNSRSFGEPGCSEFKDLAQKEERGQAGPTTQRPLGPAAGRLQERKFAEEVPGASGLPSQGLPRTRDPSEGLGWSLAQDRAELQKLLGIAVPQTQSEEAHPGQSGEAAQALREGASGGPGWERPPGENKDALQGQRGDRPESRSQEGPQGGGVKSPPLSHAWEEAPDPAPAQPRLESDSLRPGGLCSPLGAQMPQPEGRESPGPQLMQDENGGQRRASALALGKRGALLEGAPAPLPPPLPRPGAQGSGQQERPTALPGHPGPVSDRHGLQDPVGSPSPAEQQVGEARGARAGGSARLPGALGERRGSAGVPTASRAAWFGGPGGAPSAETALQRLLELHCAARRRRRQDREQQRLRVLERLRIARNRHRQVHPLVPAPDPAQLPSQDAAGPRPALREQLQQVHRERTGRLRALGARNTQNFQQLLWPPGTEEPAPGE